MQDLHLLPISRDLRSKTTNLRDFFQRLDGVLVAFSGGVDSTLVLKIAADVLGDQAIAVTAASPTLPREELDAVHQLSDEISARLIVTSTNQLDLEAFVRNDSMRCYHCKTDLYRLLAPIQQETGIATIVDGVHVDDLGDDRPGIQAAREFGVRSPLVEAGFGKADVRALAKTLGLSNWDKPAAACLSSRIPRGTRITEQKLQRVEQAERLLKEEGFRQVRVRDHDGIARIEVDRHELPNMLDPVRRDHITRGLKALGFQFVTLDLEGYRLGGVT
ncbi:MAG: ATP-dependent sacrificial sulfur transferase LarE [Nitrospira sp. SB0675_bin_23]|nr:ATP-dependent sacrificial sulfur transferase LarE [Nitrospira sp. SB0667_bin_9]MYD30288.1 ATP-dependent sacrificial sulfur transferase LarE [Nitrospira sp. SB0661_bin_20]MYH02550.1 ATP-dependent sacrificial sulfur transferase LarE [Nitrospira sp. SB0675_bin_23]MYJ22664.1 ATP-dependent sacrificial sulfur transferase LarE [Nitrospira sp. SB0673_bin_12]